MSPKTRIALIGAGGVGVRHAKVLSAIEGVEVTAVADVSLENATRLADELGAKAFGTPQEALDAGRADAGYVCVPPFAHGAAEQAVLDRGLPLFVEKPVGLDLATTERIAARVAETGVVTGSGYHWRCLSTTGQARELLAEAPAVLANGFWLGKRPPVPWWAWRDRSGGQVVEQLAHVLDLARFLLGEPVRVVAAGRRTDERPDGELDGDIDDATTALVTFASGTVATMTASCALPALYGAALHTISHGVHLALSEAELVVTRGEQVQRHRREADPRELIDADFIAAVRGEREQAVAPYADALASHRFALAITESAATGRPVELTPSGGTR
ncbi:oxidoreductase [Enemella dayhoffiae]|uniref:Oxidoreductase n=1 Tax=Enemella dayhoffiae TaxID=2016507 RepID=A0A255GSW0_9ACTN|nr:Gfo/Idh/MocA family oxidoreductase [Enemella dayhoffiae]OYO18681.1 oxidoreductase [Enemella dayhoffiae]